MTNLIPISDMERMAIEDEIAEWIAADEYAQETDRTCDERDDPR